MKYTIEVDGFDIIEKNLGNIPKLFEDKNFKQYIGENAVKVINDIAQEKLKNLSEYTTENKIKILNDGVLIYNDVKNDNGTYYSLIIEYGSGTHAEMEHIGGTVKFNESDFDHWYVPEEIAPRLGDYNYKKIITKEGQVLYMVFGQEGKHIYTEAAEEIANNLVEWARIYVEENLDSILRS